MPRCGVASWSETSCLGVALWNVRWFGSSSEKKAFHEIWAMYEAHVHPTSLCTWGATIVSEIRLRKPAITAGRNLCVNHTILVPPFRLVDRPPLLRHVDVRPAASRKHFDAVVDQHGEMAFPLFCWNSHTAVTRSPEPHLLKTGCTTGRRGWELSRRGYGLHFTTPYNPIQIIYTWTFIKDFTNAEAIANGPSCVLITGIKSLDLCVFLVEEAAEIWPVKETNKAKLLATEMDFWDRAIKTSRREKIKNEVIRQKCQSNSQFLDDILTNQLRWYEHVQRMNGERLPKNVFEWIQEGRGENQELPGIVKRKVLVLDLDETLIHSHHDGVVRQTVKPGTPPDFVLKVTIDRHPVRFFVHKRPHVDYFLDISTGFKAYCVTHLLSSIELNPRKPVCMVLGMTKVHLEVRVV
ncbi:hypothetical protein ANN_19695 [Periplaneta americana]|uniref:FCP1 homology domain-containing protein n=1 Tax=Periplaneta americana TaxID=6978 RepID=A0ABQ8SBH7_PERAM|nr:hypothetical protein ANN_19695 [Periplaneta americana]